MRSLYMVLMMALVVSPLIPLVFADATSCVGCPEGVIRKSITSIKFLDAYFGTSSGKIEVGPGDKNVPFTISMTNVGTQDLTGIKGQLLLPAQFSSPPLEVILLRDTTGKEKQLLLNQMPKMQFGQFFPNYN